MSLTPWMIGVTIVIMLAGMLSIDLWRSYDAWRETANAADAAALAGASGLDEAHYRDTGELRLDAAAARELAAAHLDGVDDATIDLAADGSQLTVTASRTIDLALLGVFGGTSQREVAAAATADTHHPGGPP